jgi:hypothetical protein
MPKIQYSKGFQLFFVDSGKKAVDNLYITMEKPCYQQKYVVKVW